MFGKRRTPAPTEPNRQIPTPDSARWVVTIGGGFALLASAAISFEGLSGLGQMIGINPPWLLPIAIDIYAATCTLAALLLPEGHHARKTAVWNARLGLGMSMAGNAAFRALHLGAFTPQDWILTSIGAWPPLIVERLLHLQGQVNRATATVPDEAHATVYVEATAQLEDVAPGADLEPPATQLEEVAPQQQPPVAASPEVADATELLPEVAGVPEPQQPAAQRIIPAPAQPEKPDAGEPAILEDRRAARDERTELIIRLMAVHGRETVNGPKVAEEFGVERTTGYRAWKKVINLADLDQRIEAARQAMATEGHCGASEAPGETVDAEEPDRELVTA